MALFGKLNVNIQKTENKIKLIKNSGGKGVSTLLPTKLSYLAYM